MTIASCRAELVDAMTDDGFTVVDYVPQSTEGRTVITGCADPYLERGDTFGSVQVNLELFLVFETAEDQAFTDAANEAITALAGVLMSVDWSLTRVSAPFKTTNLGGRPACRVVASTNTEL